MTTYHVHVGSARPYTVRGLDAARELARKYHEQGIPVRITTTSGEVPVGWHGHGVPVRPLEGDDPNVPD